MDPEIHRIAAVQYPISGDASVEDLARRIEDWTRRAAEGGAGLVVFPELSVLDAWPLHSDAKEASITDSIARQVTPEYLKAARAAAARHGIAVLAGSVPHLEQGILRNSAFLFFEDGRQVRQDKVYLTKWGRKVQMVPGRGVQVFDAPWGRTAILVCYDAEFPDLSVALGPEAPEVILVPSMTESPEGFMRVRWASQARAVEQFAYVIVTGTVGRPQPNWAHFGQAVFLTPQSPGFPGILAEGPKDRPALVFADLNLKQLRTERNTAHFFPAREAAVGPERPTRRGAPSRNH